MRLTDHIWDQMAAAHGLKVELVKDKPNGGAQYRVTMMLDLDAQQQRFINDRLQQHRAPTKKLWHIVEHGLRLFFSDDDQPPKAA